MKSSIITAFIIAVVMCGAGGNIVKQVKTFMIPAYILGAIFGIFLLVIFICILQGKGVLFANSPEKALWLFSILIAVKFILSLLQFCYWVITK